MSNEMIELVAKAIEFNQGIEGRVDFKAMAYAAIEAMREPTQTMLDAGAYDLDMSLEQQWKRMIDAALKDG